MAFGKQIEWSPEQVAKFWDHTSQFPELYFTYQFGHSIINKLKGYLKKDSKILDYGCGTGFLIPHLLKCGFKVTGIDFSASFFKRFLKKNYKTEAATFGLRM